MKSKKKSFLVGVLTVLGLLGLIFICVGSAVVNRQKRNASLAQAVRDNNDSLVRALLAEGADPDAPMETPPITVDRLVQTVFPNRLVHEAPSLLIVTHAAKYSNAQVLESLLKAGGTPKIVLTKALLFVLDKSHTAVPNYHRRNLELLVEYGADVNFKTDATDVPLYYALTDKPDPQEVKYLLDHGADPGRINFANRTAEQMMSSGARQAKLANDVQKYRTLQQIVSLLHNYHAPTQNSTVKAL